MVPVVEGNGAPERRPQAPARHHGGDAGHDLEFPGRQRGHPVLQHPYLYNITSLNAADYVAVRPSIQPVLMERAQKFHDISLQRFGVSIPRRGHTIDNLFAAFSADMDVAEAGANYSSVNLPFALGCVYAHDFEGACRMGVRSSIFRSPFFAGAGFVGVKYLASPD